VEDDLSADSERWQTACIRSRGVWDEPRS